MSDNEYLEEVKAGMLEEIREADDPRQKARELRAEARKESLAAHGRYAWEVLELWWDIFEELADDHDDNAT